MVPREPAFFKVTKPACIVTIKTLRQPVTTIVVEVWLIIAIRADQVASSNGP